MPPAKKTNSGPRPEASGGPSGHVLYVSRVFIADEMKRRSVDRALFIKSGVGR